MTLFWALFSWAAMLPVLPIVYFTQKKGCKPKKNVIVGATMPYESHSDPAVLSLLDRYKKEIKRICWIMLVAAVPSLFFRSVGIFLTYMVTWVVVLSAVFMVPYIRCNTALRKLKEERGWRRDAGDAPQVVTDLKAAAEEMRWLSPWWFLPPFIISLIPLFFDRSIWGLWVFDGLMVPVFYLCYRYLYRNRAEVVDGDDHWIWGLLYYNPNDARMIVNARVGVNTTVNLARRPARILMGLVLALLLACPLCGIWLMGMERAPVELEVTETEIVGSHYGGHWSVALADIAEAEVIKELPPMTRVAGTGMENACTGQFNNSEWGRVTLCINPKAGPWLLVKDSNGKLFLFGAGEEGTVEEIADSLTAAGALPQGVRSIP